jgi:hypothetical protein
MRATTSTPPPGANGISIRIGRLGNFDWANAAEAALPNIRAARTAVRTGLNLGIGGLPVSARETKVYRFLAGLE